jgi:hypothetical protein
MTFRVQSVICALTLALLTVFLDAQSPPAPAMPPQPASVHAAKGMPPRANGGEYLSNARVGAITIAAEFDEHSVPTPDMTLSTEDFVAVEVGIFGGAGAHTIVSAADFSLRVNGKKSPLPVEQFAAVFRNLRDPTYNPPELAAAKESKAGSIGTGGNTQSDLGATPPPVKIPPEMERAMQLKVQNAALPEGDRVLPVAGLIFFRYGGLRKGIKTLELLYSGPAGKATLSLQP